MTNASDRIALFGRWPRSTDNGLPSRWLFADERNEALMPTLAAQLPRGTGIVLRHRTAAGIAALLKTLRPIGRARGLVLLVAGDVSQASQADGLHWPQKMLKPHRRPRRNMIMTAAAHDRAAIIRARRCGCDAVFLSPVFATRSHSGAPSLGPLRARLCSLRSGLTVFALGGVHEQNWRQLSGRHFDGFAAIDGWIRS